jgi:hypothetical protein
VKKIKAFFIVLFLFFTGLFSVEKEVLSIEGMCLHNSKGATAIKVGDKRAPQISILGMELFNARSGLPIPEFIGGRRLTNANGDIDPTSTGFKFIIDTLSYIRASVIEQKFYEVDIANYLPMDVGEAAWMEEIVQNLTFNTGGSFYEGDVDIQSDTSRLAQVGAALAPIRMPVKTWAKATGWSIMEISKAAAANRWDVVESKLKSLKKNWDLGIQRTAFLGHPDGTITGLLNASEVNINTTLITVPISEMSETQFAALVAGLLPAYFTNSNSTQLPDTFIIPTDSYLGMATPFSTTFPAISKLEYLLNSLKKMTANENFQILPLAYAQSANNVDAGLTKDRHVLYRNDADDMAMSIPVDFTMLEADTSNKVNWQQAAYGQYSGVLVNRKRGVYYLDETST